MAERRLGVIPSLAWGARWGTGDEEPQGPAIREPWIG
jgi:hypothetical protein